MLHLMEKAQLTSALRDFGKTHAVWGICAGAILIAQEVTSPEQYSLGLIPVRARRNYYGSQADSFKDSIKIDFLNAPMEVDFIRAPLLEALSRDVRAHATHDGHGVLLQHGHIMVSAFHVELGQDTRLHEYFLKVPTQAPH